MNLCTDIRTYVRNSKGQPIGIILATKSTREGHKYHIGWASCNTNLDKFDKTLAIKIAVGRLTAAEDQAIPYVAHKMPHKVSDLITRFKDRCDRYFK